jgi:hypothetical protein
MEAIFVFIHSVMPLVYAVAALLVILKVIITTRYKGFDFTAFVLSFFKLYVIKGRGYSNKRKRYMRYTNLLNLALYALLLLFLLMLIIFRGNVFKYS